MSVAPVGDMERAVAAEASPRSCSRALPTLAAFGVPFRGYPPPPHDPRDRVVIDQEQDWLVLQFEEGDARLEYFAPRGMLHLQLWHPIAEVSVLTPSSLTAWSFEVFPVAGWKYRSPCACCVARLVLPVHGGRVPSISALQRLYDQHIVPLIPSSRPSSLVEASPAEKRSRS